MLLSNKNFFFIFLWNLKKCCPSYPDNIQNQSNTVTLEWNYLWSGSSGNYCENFTYLFQSEERGDALKCVAPSSRFLWLRLVQTAISALHFLISNQSWSYNCARENHGIVRLYAEAQVKRHLVKNILRRKNTNESYVWNHAICYERPSETNDWCRENGVLPQPFSKQAISAGICWERVEEWSSLNGPVRDASS